MRNLELFCHTDRLCDQINNVEHFCVNALENALYIYDDGVMYRLSQTNGTTEIFNLKEHCRDELDSQVVAMEYNSLLGTVCLATARGDLLLVQWGSRVVEVVGSVKQGLHCASWSPEEELLLLVTGADAALAMTVDWCTAWECALGVEAAPPTVALGWGSASTQFQGSRGKTAAEELKLKVAPTASPRDDGSACASWRGDGALVAVSVPLMPGPLRRISVLTRDGTLLAVSEEVPGLEMALAWRPSGNVFASTQVLPNKYQVVFFEKNGLRHGEFTLPFLPGEGVVRHLAWNTESDVLSVWYEDCDAAHLLFCSVGNYHWYVKQKFTFPLKSRLLACRWDPEARLKLHVLYGSVRYSVFEWMWTVNHSSPYAVDDRAQVAVIDGKELLLTAFAEKVVPPPMSAERLQLPSMVNQVTFGPALRSDSLCVALSDGRLALFDGPDRMLRWVRRVQVALEHPVILHHWLWAKEDSLLCVCTAGSTSQLLQVNLQEADDDVLVARTLEVAVVHPVVSLCLVGDGSREEVLVQTAEGSLLLLRLAAQTALEPLSCSSEQLLQLHALPVGGRAPCVVGLSGRSRLYVDGAEVAHNVTSVLLLPPDGLLLTTSTHVLLALRLRLAEQGQDGKVPCTLSEAVSRRVERGARLVTAACARVVLQMPRGNLETVTPRALVLQQAAVTLDQRHFASVFELFRKQRINLNLLVDHNPTLFLECAVEFVRDIRNPSWLSLLAVELSEEDVTKTAYADTYRGCPRPAPMPWGDGGKCATVCARLQEAMEIVASEGTRPTSAFYLPLLSTLVAGAGQQGRELTAALHLVQTAPEKGLSCDDGLRHLLTLCDARCLFDAALGLYDTELAAKVAGRSGRDPKEYLPFLNELRRLDETYRCYKVDVHLRRWHSALSHLALCPGHFEEFLKVTQEHLLYGHALTLLDRSDERCLRVAAAYGTYLMKERKLEEAAVMLRRAGRREEALEACRQSGDWQQALVLLRELAWAPEQCAERMQPLATVLLQQRRFAEAAQVLLHHCKCVEEAVSALCQGRLWAEAQAAAIDAQRLDLLGGVNAGVAEHLEQLQAEVGSHRTTYEAHLRRLRVVRAEKLRQLEERDGEVGPESDLYSDTSSLSGSGSGSYQSGRSGSYSGRSSRSGKNRRKQERKLLSLKEGAPFEDLALLRALHQTASTCLALRKEVRALCLAMVAVERDTDAAALQQSLSAALDLVEQSKAEVWPPELTAPNCLAVEERYGPEATANSIVSSGLRARALVQNCDLLEPQFRIAPQTQDHINWKLSILGT